MLAQKSLGARLGRRPAFSGRSSNCPSIRSYVGHDHGLGPWRDCAVDRALEVTGTFWICRFSQAIYTTVLLGAGPTLFDPCGPMVPDACRPCRAKLVTTSFFELSYRTRSSFELACPAAFGDVSALSRAPVPLFKGESCSDTARPPPPTLAMGAGCAGGAATAARCSEKPGRANLNRSGERVRVLNGGDGLHSHPSQGIARNLFHPGASVRGLRPHTPQALGRQADRDHR